MSKVYSVVLKRCSLFLTFVLFGLNYDYITQHLKVTETLPKQKKSGIAALFNIENYFIN